MDLYVIKKGNLTEEIPSITAGSDRGSYAKPLLCKRYRLTWGCVSLNFRPEKTKVLKLPEAGLKPQTFRQEG